MAEKPPEDKFWKTQRSQNYKAIVRQLALLIQYSFKILPTQYKRQEPSHVGGIGNCVLESSEDSVGNHQNLTVGNPVTEERVNEERENAMAKSVSKIRDMV